jgi:hypothetical protein
MLRHLGRVGACRSQLPDVWSIVVDTLYVEVLSPRLRRAASRLLRRTAPDP